MTSQGSLSLGCVTEGPQVCDRQGQDGVPVVSISSRLREFWSSSFHAATSCPVQLV